MFIKTKCLHGNEWRALQRAFPQIGRLCGRRAYDTDGVGRFLFETAGGSVLAFTSHQTLGGYTFEAHECNPPAPAGVSAHAALHLRKAFH